MKKKLSTVAVLLLTMVFLSAVSFAEGKDIIVFDCTYPTYSDGAKIKANKEAGMAFKFVVDTVAETALIVGANGGVEITMFYSSLGNSVQFIELTGSNNVMTTVVSLTDGQSVHSRHFTMQGDIIPSQYYGSCKILS